MVISLVSFGLFGPALSTTNINIVKWRYFVIFSPVFICSLNWEFSYSNWEKNILFGIGNTTEYRSSKRAKKNPDCTNLSTVTLLLYCLKVFSRCICSRVSLFSLLSYIAAPPTFYQISMNNGLFQKTKVEFHD